MSEGNIEQNPGARNPQGLRLVNFNEVTEPGIYVDIQKKRIFRIPSEILNPTHAGTRMVCLPDFQVVKIGAHPLQDRRNDAFTILDEGSEQMFRFNRLVVVARGDLLNILQGFLRFQCELIEIHFLSPLDMEKARDNLAFSRVT